MVSFVHAQAREWITVTISDGKSQRTDTMGVAIGATNCIDPSLGESELPPVPPTGIFDCRFLESACTPAIQGLSLDFHNAARDTTSFYMSIQKDTTLPILMTLQHGWTAIFPYIEIYDASNSLDVVMATGPERDTLTLGYSVTARGVTTYYDVTSPVINITTCTDCVLDLSAPSLASPQNGADVLFLIPNVSWSAVTSATGYHLQIASDSLFDSGAMVVDDSGITTPSKDLGSLPVGRTYFWRVEALNGDAVSGWSPVWRFGTVYSTPFRYLIGVTITNGAQSMTDSMGVAIGATDCIDPGLGEIEWPPPPVSVFQAIFVESCAPPIQGLMTDLHAASQSGDTAGTPFEILGIQRYDCANLPPPAARLAVAVRFVGHSGYGDKRLGIERGYARAEPGYSYVGLQR